MADAIVTKNWRDLIKPRGLQVDQDSLTSTYGKFIAGLKKADVEIDRKILADLAVSDKAAFAVLAEKAKAALGAA